MEWFRSLPTKEKAVLLESIPADRGAPFPQTHVASGRAMSSAHLNETHVPNAQITAHAALDGFVDCLEHQ